jgi:translation initiation factor eIF-2B subunit beta
MVVSYVLSLESKLSSACPREMSIRNMVRRVLGIIREEAENQDMGDLFKAAMEADEERQQHDRLKPASRTPLLTTTTSFAVGQQSSVTSLFHVLSQANTPSVTGPSSAASSPTSTGVHTPIIHNFNLVKEFRPAVIQDIQELIEELASSESAIAEYAPQLIHKNELILIYGLPPTVHHLLLRAAQKKGHDFTAVIVEGSPNTYKRTHGAAMNSIPPSEDDEDGEIGAARKSLQERGIQVIVISDADVYNFIGRANKVFLAANYVLADGSVVATSGALNVARAAKAHQKPVLVVAGSHVLCPVTSFYQEILIEMGAPVTVGYDEGYLLENAEFPNPLVDFIPSELITMFVTNK